MQQCDARDVETTRTGMCSICSVYRASGYMAVSAPSAPPLLYPGDTKSLVRGFSPKQIQINPRGYSVRISRGYKPYPVLYPWGCACIPRAGAVVRRRLYPLGYKRIPRDTVVSPGMSGIVACIPYACFCIPRARRRRPRLRFVAATVFYCAHSTRHTNRPHVALR
jgi:hypothetical protein